MEFSLVVLLVGIVVVLSILVKEALARAGLPSIVGYLVLGFSMRAADWQWEILPSGGMDIFEFLAALGIFCLLFRVGLESDLPGLVKQLRRASVIWAGNMFFSGMLGFSAAYFLIGLTLIPSLFVGVALTATSIGIAVAAWEEADALDSPAGRLLLDVAEMDDISGVVLMALLLTVAPVLLSGGSESLWPILSRTTAFFLGKGLIFGAACFLFSRFAERHVTEFVKRIESGADPMLTVAGVGIIIAAFAELLGLSLAIGSFFAGLAFSRDPEAVKIEASFNSVYDFFVPFFFIGIGLDFDPELLGPSLGIGAVLLAAAVLGKIIGAGGPALLICGRQETLLLGISMTPRAEIAMIVMQHGRNLGSWAVPSKVFGAMVLVSAVTTLLAPIVLRRLLAEWPEERESQR